MDKETKRLLLYAALIISVVILGSFMFKAFNLKQKSQAGIANPASVYCVEQGFNLTIETANDGSQTGFCVFPNGAKCEEWSYFRGECKAP